MTGLIVAIILTGIAFALGVWVGCRWTGKVVAAHALDIIIKTNSSELRQARALAYRDLFETLGARGKLTAENISRKD